MYIELAQQLGHLGCVAATSLSVLLAIAILVCIVLELIEMFDLFVHRPDHGPPLPANSGSFQPFVSIHLPVRAEPPSIVARTLQALAELEYAHFEVLVIYNNTPDESLWQPIESLCEELGERFRFFNVPHLEGYKAGAQNVALRKMSPHTTIICPLDCDYVVRPDFLKVLTPAFENPYVTFVQCPQDYREWTDIPFLRMCYWEYWQFFAVGMVLRARRNAAMLHGTMSLIRASAAIRVGGWAEWCLTEDSEMGIRLLADGGRGLYFKYSYGLGIMPLCFADYKRQRRRWVIGGAQQLRRHGWQLVCPSNLTHLQRLHQLQGWLPWLRDGLIVALLPFLSGLAWYAVFDVQTAWCLLPVATALIVVLGHHALRQWIICRWLLGLSWRDTAGAMCAVIGLTWVDGVAWLKGSFVGHEKYFRTPKEPPLKRLITDEARAERVVALMMIPLSFLLLARLSGWSCLVCLAPLAYSALMVPALIMARASKRDMTSTSSPAVLERPAAAANA
jgi:cellulose synthase/poly-beta-1,6-N-acetylglucosamine synthase-like glycosyltransferase